jgi:REP element-mobilizing transposase RayT
MARPLRIEFAGAVYHIISRGNAQQSVFLDDTDRRRFLRMLWSVAGRLDWGIWAYCLMPNHYHLLLQTPQPTLSSGMRDLNGVYSQSFNRRHRRVGHLFQGRFRSLIVDSTAYVIEVARYILLNPVQAGISKLPEGCQWTSYRATVGMARRPRRLITGPLLAPFASARDDGRTEFADYVRRGIGLADPADRQRVPTVIGDDSFVARVFGYRPDPSTEVPRAERAHTSLAAFARAGRRDEAIRAAYSSGLYTQREIARHFRLHYTTVSRIIGNSRFHDANSKDLTP